MTTSKKIAVLLCVFALGFVPHAASAASTPFFGPLIPDACNCPHAGNISAGSPVAPDYGCLLAVAQRAINLLVTLGMFLLVFMIVRAGWNYLTSGANPAAHKKARDMILNVIIGMVLVLAAWLIVDFVMKQIYNPNSGFGPWNQILSSSNTCISAKTTSGFSLFDFGVVPGNPGGGAGTVGGGGGNFTYDPGVQAQVSAESGSLSNLLSCIAGKVPAGVGRISSISDHVITDGTHTFAECAAQGHAICSHTVNSCHYGGRSCIGQSYAVDFGDDQNASVLQAAATACKADFIGFEGTHLHVSMGASCGCN